jgi:hypothetical protein
MKVEPPTTTNRIKNFSRDEVEADARATHILVHPRYPALLASFLAYKRAHGSRYEKELYDTMTWKQLAARFLHCRPLTCMGSSDATLMRDGTVLDKKAYQEWDRNGTDLQYLNSHLTLENYLSYD